MLRKTMFAAAVACAFAFCSASYATEATPPAKTPTPQQQRMSDCNKQAEGKKGDERKKFMSTCLKGDSTAKAAPAKQLTPQQQKMKTCNADATAKGLKGDERKKFMSTCLKAK